ncbi:MAG: hypothetical protein JO332_13615, partial [Planctomycetaceae bacterium]|nr:hypothetical protein [Planctomycetaceae bacterium]
MKPRVRKGPDCEIDRGVLLGYPPARKIVDASLAIGARARIRSGSVLYGGSTIGDD